MLTSNLQTIFSMTLPPLLTPFSPLPLLGMCFLHFIFLFFVPLLLYKFLPLISVPALHPTLVPPSLPCSLPLLPLPPLFRFLLFSLLPTASCTSSYLTSPSSSLTFPSFSLTSPSSSLTSPSSSLTSPPPLLLPPPPLFLPPPPLLLPPPPLLLPPPPLLLPPPPLQTSMDTSLNPVFLTAIEMVDDENYLGSDGRHLFICQKNRYT